MARECEFVNPETTVLNGTTMEQEVVPEHKCDLPGTNLRRCGKEMDVTKPRSKTKRTSIRLDSEKLLCGIHFTPGILTLLDGTKVEVPSRPASEKGRFDGTL